MRELGMKAATGEGYPTLLSLPTPLGLVFLFACPSILESGARYTSK